MDFTEPLAASTQDAHVDEGRAESQTPEGKYAKANSRNQDDSAAEKVVSESDYKTVLTQEIPAQIPGFLDCADEELRSVDSAEIVDEILSDVKGSGRSRQYKGLTFGLSEHFLDSQSQEEQTGDKEDEEKTKDSTL